MAADALPSLACMPYSEFQWASTISILTHVMVPRFWGLFERPYALELPTKLLKNAQRMVDVVSVSGPSVWVATTRSMTMDVAAFQDAEGQALMTEYLAELRRLYKRLGPKHRARLEDALHFSIKLAIDTAEAGGRRIWLDDYEMDGLGGLRKTIDAIDGAVPGRELVLVDTDSELDGGALYMGEFWSVHRDGVRFVYSDWDDDTEACGEERRYHARLRYHDFVDTFKAEANAIARLLRPVAEAVGRGGDDAWSHRRF